MFSLFLNANLILVFVSFLSLASFYTTRESNKVLDLKQVIYRNSFVLGFLVILLSIVRRFFPINLEVSLFIFASLLLLSVGIIVKHKNNLKITFRLKTTVLSLILFNLFLVFTFSPVIKNQIVYYTSRNADVLVHESFIEEVKKYSYREINQVCKDENKNLFTRQICVEGSKVYPKGSYVLIAFWDNLLPRNVFIKSNYAFVVVAIISLSLLSLIGLSRATIFLIPLILLHPSIHFALGHDHVSQSVSSIFFLLFIETSKSRSAENVILFSLITFYGFLVTYPYLLVFLLPIMLIIVLIKVAGKLSLSNFDKKKVTGSAFFALISLWFSLDLIKIVDFFINEKNPGGVDFLQVRLMQAVGGYFEFFGANQNIVNLTQVTATIYIAFLLLLLIWLGVFHKLVLTIITIATLIMYGFVKLAHVYWIYKVSFGWVYLLIVLLLVSLGENKKIRKIVFAPFILLEIFLGCLWATGNSKAFYENDFREIFSLEINKKLDNINYAGKKIGPELTTYVNLDSYSNQILSIKNSDAILVADAHYVSTSGEYQYFPEKDNHFVSNLNLGKIDRIVIDKKTYNFQFIPLLYKETEVKNDIAVFDKTVNNFDILPISKLIRPLVITDETLFEPFRNKKDLLVKYILSGKNQMCDYYGDGDRFVEKYKNELPIILVNAYLIKDKNNTLEKIAFGCNKFNDVIYNGTMSVIDLGAPNDEFYINNFLERALFPDGRTFRWSKSSKELSSIMIPNTKDLKTIKIYVAPENLEQIFSLKTDTCNNLSNFKFEKHDVNIFAYNVDEIGRNCLEKDRIINFFSQNPEETKTPYQFLFDKIEFIYD